MKMHKVILGAGLAALLFTSGVLVGQDVGRRHPNLMAAQRLMEQATARIDAAQQANEWDMGGHAAKAKELLGQAYEQVKMAAMAANRR